MQPAGISDTASNHSSTSPNKQHSRPSTTSHKSCKHQAIMQQYCQKPRYFAGTGATLAPNPSPLQSQQQPAPADQFQVVIPCPGAFAHQWAAHGSERCSSTQCCAWPCRCSQQAALPAAQVLLCRCCQQQQQQLLQLQLLLWLQRVHPKTSAGASTKWSA